MKEPNSPPRRSRRPSKIKDYAAMIRDRTGLDSEDEDSQDEDEDRDQDPDEDSSHFEASEKKTSAVITHFTQPKLFLKFFLSLIVERNVKEVIFLK